MAKPNANRMLVVMLVSMAGDRFAYQPGDRVDVDETTGENWLDSNQAILEADVEPPPVKVHPEPRPAPTDEAVVKAIGKLDPKKDYRSGRPILRKVEDALKTDVGEVRLDRCFDQYLANQRKAAKNTAADEGELAE